MKQTALFPPCQAPRQPLVMADLLRQLHVVTPNGSINHDVVIRLFNPPMGRLPEAVPLPSDTTFPL